MDEQWQEGRGVDVASAAYLALLRLPPLYRMQVQSELCMLRDYIAGETGIDAEDVQDRHEHLASQSTTVR
jgi:hypothetical protein